MTAPIADLDSGFPVKSLLTNLVFWWAHIPISAAGATGTIKDAPQGFACANAGTGVFNVTGMPPCPATTTSNSKATFWFSLQSPAATVTECVISTAHNLANGTVSFTTSKAGTAANPADGDVVRLFCVMERE